MRDHGDADDPVLPPDTTTAHELISQLDYSRHPSSSRERAAHLKQLLDLTVASPIEPVDARVLADMMFWDTENTAAAARALGALCPGWRDRLTAMSEAVSSSGTITREGWSEYYAKDVFADVPPSELSELRKELVELMLRNPGIPRYRSVLAGVLVEVSGNRENAGTFLDEYQDLARRTYGAKSAEARQLAVDLLPIRVEVGGETALRPLLDEVENQFRDQLEEIRKKVLDQWDRTDRAVRTAFFLRVAMSVSVFVFGLVVTWLAVRAAISGDRQDLWGAGISLVAGLGAMLAVVYSSPLQDIGASSASLTESGLSVMTYVHSLQFVAARVAGDAAHGRLDESSVASAVADLDRLTAHTMSRLEKLAGRPPTHRKAPRTSL